MADASANIILIGIAAFASAVVSGLGGFGGAFIIIIALTPIVGPKAVIPLIAVFAVCNNLSRIVIYRKTIEWRLAVHFTLASLPGVYAGARILAWIPERALFGLLGCALLAAIPLRRYLRRRRFRPGPVTITAMGLIFGLVSGTAAGSGMFVIAGLSSVGLQGALLLGTDAAIGIVNAVSRVAAYASLGLLNRELLIGGFLMGVMTLPGAWVASRIVAAMGDRLHSWFIEILIAGGGLWLLYQAV